MKIFYTKHFDDPTCEKFTEFHVDTHRTWWCKQLKEYDKHFQLWNVKWAKLHLKYINVDGNIAFFPMSYCPYCGEKIERGIYKLKSRYKVNILFLINAVMVGILSLGVAFFTLVPLIMGFIEPQRILSAATQNYAMIGLWMIYFTSIIFLPITLNKTSRRWKIAFGIFVIGIVIFILFITGIFSCWEFGLYKFLGMDYNDRLRC